MLCLESAVKYFLLGQRIGARPSGRPLSHHTKPKKIMQN